MRESGIVMHWLSLPPEELTATSDPFLGASNMRTTGNSDETPWP